MCSESMGDIGECARVGASVAFDSIADALGHRARRRVLMALLDHNPLDYREAIAGSVSRDRTDAELQMVHTHLPKLDDMGYVDWNRESGTVMKGDQWDEIEPTLRLLTDNRERLPGDAF